MNGNKTNFIIFGGTGDLSYRKLLPALYNLFVVDENRDINVICIGRRAYTFEDYIEIIKPWIEKNSRVEFTEDKFLEFIKKIKYCVMDFTNKDEYHILSNYLKDLNVTENIFYLAVAPRFFNVIGEGISKLTFAGGSKIVIEKPFGETLNEANLLNQNLEKWFSKENVYHIDHYLGKEMVQNLLTVRFSNPIFSKNWNKESIECIQIIASEEEGVGTRAGYYDQSGALKDMVQNHLMQILSIVAMESPDENNSIKSRQVEVLKQLKSVEEIDVEKHMILGQYNGYLNEDNVAENSSTETLAFCKLYVDNERWSGVPFYILTGKALKSRELNVIVTFKSENGGEPNVLTFKIQPTEGVTLSFNIKKPGTFKDQLSMNMDHLQSNIPSYQINTPEAYEGLFVAIMECDHTLFANWEQIYASWIYIDKLKNKFKEKNLKLINYDKTSILPDLMQGVLDNKSHFCDYSQFNSNLERKE
ncbi:MAG: glucose-6-phosphate dehydrogenase [bacterium]